MPPPTTTTRARRTVDPWSTSASSDIVPHRSQPARLHRFGHDTTARSRARSSTACLRRVAGGRGFVVRHLGQGAPTPRRPDEGRAGPHRALTDTLTYVFADGRGSDHFCLKRLTRFSVVPLYQGHDADSAGTTFRLSAVARSSTRLRTPPPAGPKLSQDLSRHGGPNFVILGDAGARELPVKGGIECQPNS